MVVSAPGDCPIGMSMTLSELSRAKSDASTSARPDPRSSVVVGLAFLPWLIVVLLTTGVWGSINFVGYVVAALAIGYGIVWLAVPRAARVECVLLAPALGIFTMEAVGAFWLRLGFPHTGVAALWLCLIVPGALSFWADREVWNKQRIAYGPTVVALSVLICLVYFLPSARNDAVLRRDGSFNWIYVDTQHFYSIAAGIKSGDGPPKIPGTATADLAYHFGPYVPAAVISRLTGLDLGDSLARVTRGASLFVLILSTFALGSLLSHKATGERFGGVMSVAGLFFYGSLMSLFTEDVNSSSYVKDAILFKIPGVGVVADGGPFAHLIFGHSVLHGLVAITSTAGLCFVYRENCDGRRWWRSVILLVLPALVVPVNSVAALYCLGVVAILVFWGRLQKPWSWLAIVLMVCIFFGAWKIMGMTHSSDATGITIKHHLVSQWWTITVAFLIGLGFRIIGFKWISRPLSDPVSALVLATVIGLLSFSLLLQLEDGNERYGIYYLQSMFSIFAFSRLMTRSWRSVTRSEWAIDWLRFARNGLLILVAAAIAMAGFYLVAHRHTGIAGFGVRVGETFVLALVLAGIALGMKHNVAFSSVASAVLMTVLAVGFLAWIAPWLDCGNGRMRLDVSVTSGELAGLHRLRDLAKPDEWFATNRHDVDSLASRRERSYAYTGLSERPVLLEGYLDRGVTRLPWFHSMLQNNDEMFSTSDPATLHRIAESYNIHWLVARPGTDIAISRPLPPWLVEQENTGALKIYRID
jgi:hypothetical protein